MGQFARAIDKVDPISRQITGSKGLDVWGTGEEDKEKKKMKKEREAAEAKMNKTSEASYAPNAQKSNVNSDLLNKQGEKRRRLLLTQSTGNKTSGLNIK